MRGTLAERFEAKYIPIPHCGCWAWTGFVKPNGYGQIGLGKRGMGIAHAHRVAYELYVGPIPTGMTLDHLCRVRCCVNPDHLEPVTNAENIRRGDSGKATGRQQRAKTHCLRGHEYTPENTIWDRRGNRCCRACRPINERNNRLAKKGAR